MRYNKQIALPEVGEAGQQKLAEANVLVVGAGGLGCPVLQYLVAAGIGTIGIVDGDVVNETNLHRQVLYTKSDVGKPKVEVAAERLDQLNPEVIINTYSEFLTAKNAMDIVANYDLIVDATDNFAARYRINDVCVKLDKPFVYGAIHRFEGQVSVFNYKGGPTYRCFFPEYPTENQIPNCNETGVLGVLPGIVGTYQATEVLKMILGIGEVLSGKLMTLNLLTNSTRTFEFSRNEEQVQKAQEKGVLVLEKHTL
ncbi:MAG: HesA/MoeB/ThiF family protein [Flavobacteriales bacterium]|nr:HesA/MoeB/ThiF family protein [Flavobacteriales bacterium]